MGQHSPDTELAMAAHGALPKGDQQKIVRLAEAVAALDGLMLSPIVAQVRDAARAYLATPDGAAAEALIDALGAWARSRVTPRPAPRSAGPSRADLAALAGEDLPAWTGRADLQ